MHGRKRTAGGPSEAEILKLKAKAEKYGQLRAAVFRMRADRACNEEALALTAQFLAVSPENYTIWNYRREILKELLKDKTEEESKAICKQELSVVDSALAVNPKVYCLWWHRRWLIGTGFCDPQRELQLCAKYLDLDERNFHTWYYRMDMAKLVRETPEDALAFTTKKINQNCSNYSAWHFRSKFYPQSMQKSSPKGDACLTPDVLKSELALVQQAYFTEPSDQSAWLYHRWLLNESKVLHPEERKDLLQQECARVEELLSLEPEAKCT
eukprot:tig00000350_g24327.t1